MDAPHPVSNIYYVCLCPGWYMLYNFAINDALPAIYTPFSPHTNPTAQDKVSSTTSSATSATVSPSPTPISVTPSATADTQTVDEGTGGGGGGGGGEGGGAIAIVVSTAVVTVVAVAVLVAIGVGLCWGITSGRMYAITYSLIRSGYYNPSSL